MSDGFCRHTPVLAGVKVVRALSVDSALLPHLGDVIGDLANAWMWTEVGDSVSDIVGECAEAVDSWYSPMMIGQVSQFLGSLPAGWLALDGSTYDEVDYPELWSVLDDQFKNEPASTFTLPNTSGLVSVAAGDGFVVGDVGGVDTVTLSLDQIPGHTHNYQSVLVDIEIKTVGAPIPYGARIGPLAPTSSAGGGQAHDNMQPYYVFVVGIFAGRG